MTPDLIDVPAAVARLRVLANPARLRIVLRLLDGEQSVSQLETELALKQPNLSQYLGELRDAGLVVTRRKSRTIFYRLADEKARLLVSALLQGFGGVPLRGPTVLRRPYRRTAPAATFAVLRAGI